MKPVACPRLTVPAELEQLRDWLVTNERDFEKRYERLTYQSPIPGLSAQVINRFIQAAAHINAALERNDMIDG